MRDILESIHYLGKLHPRRPAVILHDRLVTYGMLRSGILSVEQRLAALSIDRERLAAVCIDNPARHLIVTLALRKAGVSTISLPSNAPFQTEPLNIGTVFADQPGWRATHKHVVVTDEWFTASVKTSGWDIADIESGRVCRVSMTSGSTGSGKAIASSELAMRLRVSHIQRRLAPYGRILIVFGLTAHIGMTSALAALGQGQSAIFGRSIEDCMHLIPSAAVDGVFASTQQLADMVRFERERGGGPFDTVRGIVTGGAYLSTELLNDVQSLFSCEVYQCYASTEAGLTGMATAAFMRANSGGGRYVPTADIRIEDADPSDPLGIGRIAIHTEHLGRPYDGSLAPRRSDDWFYPGDLGYIDNDGCLVVVGRADDLINMRGVKRSAEFIEDHFMRSPLVKDCAIVRLDTAAGPEIVMFVACDGQLDEGALGNWGLQHALRFEVDRFVQVQVIPRTGMEKIDRAGVRRMAEALP